MRKLSFVTMILTCLANAAFAETKVPGFFNHLEEAKKAAAEQNKPLYLHFTTDWCTWCRRIESQTYPAPQVQAALGNFVAATLDCTVPEGQKPTPEAEANIKLMTRLGGGGYPFLAMITPEMAVLNTVNGYVKPDELAKALDEAATTNDELKAVDAEYAKAMASDSKDYAVWQHALKLYSKVRLWDKAAAAGQRVRALDAENQKGDAAEAAFAMLNVAMDAPAADEKAKVEQARKVAELREQVVKFDPANERGVLQKVMLVQALTILNQIKQDTPPAERQKLLQASADILDELMTKARKLDDAGNIYFLHGRVLAELGRWSKAEAAFTKALDADPQGPAADRLRQIIEDVKKRQMGS